MKQLLLAVFGVVLCTVLSAQTVQRLVLTEEFTNASCPPCEAQNPGFNLLMENNTAKAVVLKYQTDWPGYDPMNEQNPDEVQTRVTYYGVTGVPNVRIDGTTNAGTAGQVTQAMINTAYAIPSKLAINLTHVLSADLSTIDIKCEIINPDTLNEFNVADARLRLAIIEKNLYFPTPPGSTAETHFNYVMRKMLPDAVGTLVGAIAAGDTATFSWSVTLPDYIYNYGEIGAVAFVQAHGAKTTYQAAISQPAQLAGYPDLGFAANTIGNSGICDKNVTPQVEVSNDGDVDITSFDATVTFNGSQDVTTNWTGTLAPGTSTTVTFDPLELPSGTTLVQYSITNINGGAIDINSLNEIVPAEEYGALSASATSAEAAYDFESDIVGGLPASSIAEREDDTDMLVVSKDLFGSPNPVGGFGQSENSILSEIYFMLAGVEASLTFDKLDFTEHDFDTLTFDVAYRSYAGESDRLKVEISTDCGGSWEEVYNKAGSELQTIGASTTYFIPTAANWRTETVDLNAWAGQTDVIVRFHVISAYGNNLFLDNINVQGSVVSGVEDVLLNGKVNIYPNPASAEAHVDFTLSKATDLTVGIYDLTGKLVETLVDNASYHAGAFSLVWKNPAHSGTYLVKIKTDEGEITKRLSVVK